VSASFDFTIHQWEAFPWDTAEYPGRETDPLATRIREYANSYWRDRLKAEGSRLEPAGSVTRQVRFTPDQSWWPGRTTLATANQLDLSEHYNERLEGPFHPGFGPDRPNSSLSALPTGLQHIGAVAFDVRGIVQLRRHDARGGPFQQVWNHYPTRVDAFRVDQRFALLHVLHGSAVEGEERTPVGAYELHYADGQIARLEITYGVHLRSWREEDDAISAATKSEMVWSDEDPGGAHEGAMLRLYRCTYRNPRPEVAVKSLSFVAGSASTGPFLIAATVE
jgi:hypothetical protein